MSDSLVDRITYRLKYVSGVDRLLLMAARDALEAAGGVDAKSVYAWLLENDIKPMGWQKKRFGEMGVEVE